MSPAVGTVSAIDRLVIGAHRDLGAARSAFARTPSGAAVTACRTAEARLDELSRRPPRPDARRPPAAGET